ncbi:hypothetical protein L7F22_032136 [Adiantum nelumboides]|nr:hypothetical protein [Adiantum nelumboides]
MSFYISAVSDAGACGGMTPSVVSDVGVCGGMTPSAVSDAGACGGMTPSDVSDAGACGDMNPSNVYDARACGGQHSVSWRNFKVALKTEYFLEDSQRVTKQTFIKWVQMKNKGLTSRELLREFEKKFDQLSTGEQQSLRSEKVELFVQAADSRLQKSLVQLLEDPAGEFGLTNDWDAVPAAINLLVKRQRELTNQLW